MIIPKDIIIQNCGTVTCGTEEKIPAWSLYNVFTRDVIAVNNDVLRIMEMISEGLGTEEIKNKITDVRLFVWDISVFSNYYGLLNDPTRILRDTKNWPQPKNPDIDELLRILEKKHMIILDEGKYNGMFAPKNSILDREHMGNFHQQLGQALLVDKRENPGEWWVKQKFKPDYSDLNDNLYKSIQSSFLKSYFKTRFGPSHTVIDIGCGTGFYTKQMAESGATVMGIDPDKDYLGIAEKNGPESPKNLTFKLSRIGQKGDLDWIPSGTADFVFMSDALLFYFVSPNPKEQSDINVLFSDIRRILKPEGRFISVEPHGIYWLRPWLGEIDRPFTVMTEHTKRWFSVAPNFSQLVNAFIKGGFDIREMKELYPDETVPNIDARATQFAKEFPLWWFFELQPRKE
ncbi:class I SAM-dependent methyltransferase [Candidatus Micrarchaeota archaeon]|nr:class I SAM-dependent methyltransferase [Candidatus Micrarchaeota archaeon]